MPLHCFNGWHPVLIVCRRKYFGNEVGEMSFLFSILRTSFFKGSSGDASQTDFAECGWLGVPFSPVLNLGGHPHRYLFFHILFFLFLGMGWKPRVCTIPVVPILLLSWIITLPLQTYTIFSRKKQENSTIFHPKYIVFLFINIKINWSEYVFILLEYRKIFSCRDFDVLLEVYCYVFK